MAAGAAAAVISAPAQQQTRNFLFMNCILFPFGQKRPLPRVVVMPHDAFATASIYKWILIQHLSGFHFPRIPSVQGRWPLAAHPGADRGRAGCLFSCSR